MEIIDEGFTLSYGLQKMGRPMVGGAGDYNGRPYAASVKIRCNRITHDYDQVLGDKYREDIIEFKIPCASNAEAGDINKLFMHLYNHGIVVNLNGTMPNTDGDINKVTILDSPLNLMSKYHDLMLPKTDKPKA